MTAQFHSEANFKTTTGFIRLSRNGMLFILILFVASQAFCTSRPSTKSPSPKEMHRTDMDSINMEQLFQLSYFYCNYFGDLKTADSLDDQAIHIAEMSFRPESCLKAYLHYLEITDLQSNFEKAQKYGLKALELVKLLNNLDLEWRVYKDLAELYLSDERYNTALMYSYKAIGIAGAMEKNSLRVASYLLFARSLEGKKQKSEAHGYFLNAMELADKLKDPFLQLNCYNQLSRFYMIN